MRAKLRSMLGSYGPPLGLLALRLSFGLFMVFNHGLPKLMTFAEQSDSFADPLGAGPRVSLALAIFGELVCGALVTVGLATRLAAACAAFTMLVAGFITHAGSSFDKGEQALLYAGAFVAIALLGPGKIALDALMPRARPHNIFR